MNRRRRQARPATGLTRLVAAALWRRDRWFVLPWICVLGVLPAAYASATHSLYPTRVLRERFLTTIADDRWLTFLYGVAPEPTVGSFVSWRYGVAPLLAALVSGLVAVRHTRAEEDSGRLETLLATRAPSWAPPLVVFGWILAINAVLAAFVFFGLVSQNVAPMGSLLLAVSAAGVGVAGGAVGLLFAQLVSSAGPCRGAVGAVLVLWLVLKGVGDVATTAEGHGRAAMHLRWLSPAGWGEATHPFAGARWWPMGLFAGAAAGLVSLSALIAGRRDLGSGLTAPGDGRPEAGRLLSSSRGLALRLHLPSLAAWSLAVLATGLLLGASGAAGGEAVEGNRAFGRLAGGAGSAQGVFITAAFSLLAVAAAVYAMQATLRARIEELSGAAELVLATSVRPTRWFADHLLVGFAGVAWLMLLCGVGTVVGGQGSDLSAARVIEAALVQAPAAWILCGITALVIGVAPRFSTAAWGVLAGAVLVGQAGTVLGGPFWVQRLSPFTHTARTLLPGDTSWASTAILTMAAVALSSGGLLARARRDLST